MSGFKLSDASIPHSADASRHKSSLPPSDHPLGLTVHSSLAPGDAAGMAETLQRTSRGRWKMLVVLLVCAAPVVASYFTYYVVQPQGHGSYGVLINPQRSLPEASATTLDGQTLALPSLRGQWLLVSVGGGACNALCEKHLYLQRQLREGLGKGKERLDWVWFVNDQAPVKPALLPALKQATVLKVTGATLGQWLAPEAGHALEDHLYLVDPMGNWMMRFPAELTGTKAAQAKRDIERLLRASASWDEGGR